MISSTAFSSSLSQAHKKQVGMSINDMVSIIIIHIIYKLDKPAILLFYPLQIIYGKYYIVFYSDRASFN